MGKLIENDAAGGSGSVKDGLLAIALGGISRAVDGRLAQRYPLASQNETLDSQGRPRGAPQGISAVSGFGAALSNPLVIGGVAILALAVIITLAVRK